MVDFGEKAHILGKTAGTVLAIGLTTNSMVRHNVSQSWAKL